MRKSLAKPVWIDRFILVGAGLFIFALVVSAIFDPTIRILHAFQKLIYIAVIVLTRIAVIAGGGHFLLIVGCLAGFLRTRPDVRRWSEFVAGGLVAVVYLAAIIVTTGPQYINLLKRVFRL